MKIPVGLARPGKCSPLRCPPSLGRGTCLLAGLHFATLPHPNNQRHRLAAALRGLMCTAATVNLCEPPVPGSTLLLSTLALRKGACRGRGRAGRAGKATMATKSTANHGNRQSHASRSLSEVPAFGRGSSSLVSRFVGGRSWKSSNYRDAHAIAGGNDAQQNPI